MESLEEKDRDEAATLGRQVADFLNLPLKVTDAGVILHSSDREATDREATEEEEEAA